MKSTNQSQKRSLSAVQRENFPNTTFLEFNQCSLRLRHLTQIIGYNLTSSSGTKSLLINPLPSALPRPFPNNGYYFTMESAKKGEPDFTSDALPSNSPTWDSFDSSAIFSVNLLSLKGIVIHVWLRKEGEKETLVTSWGVNFSGLVPVSPKLPPKQDFVANTILFKLRGRYYTSSDCLASVSGTDEEEDTFTLNQGFSLSLSDTKPSYSVSSLCRLHSNKRLNRQQERRNETLKHKLASKGMRNESKRIKNLREIEDIKLRICLLSEQLEIEINKLRSIKLAAENQDCANQEKGIELLEGYQNLNRFLSSFRALESKLVEDSESHKVVVAMVKERRLYLLSQLPLVFPVKKNLEEGAKYSICDVVLPNAERYEGTSEQSLSVALGYVSQLLVKMSFLINIPLKYPITLRGSVSSIADHTSTQLLNVETQFPLYTRGKEKEKLHFNYGVFLLNKNIAQLRWSCGLSTPDLRPTLQNIWSFLSCLHDKSAPPPHAFMPDIVLVPLVLPNPITQCVQTPQSLLRHSPRLPLNLKGLSPPSPKARGKSSADEECFLELLPLAASDGLCRVDGSSKTRISGKIFKSGEYDEICPVESGVKLQNHSPTMRATRHSPIATSYLTTSPAASPRPGELQLRKERPISFSLDQGLDIISRGKHIPNTPTGSFPNLNSNDDVKVSLPSVSICEKPLPNLHEQTTQLLQSWHETDPSPYNSIIVVESSSSEKLDDVSKDVHKDGNIVSDTNCVYDSKASFDNGSVENSSPLLVNNKITCLEDKQVTWLQDRQVTCVEEKEVTSFEEKKVDKTEQSNVVNIDSGSDNCGKALISEEKVLKEDVEANNLRERLESEMSLLGLDLTDFGSDHEDHLLNDVAFRTANLASQNCSFKLSFSRQSTQE